VVGSSIEPYSLFHANPMYLFKPFDPKYPPSSNILFHSPRSWNLKPNSPSNLNTPPPPFPSQFASVTSRVTAPQINNRPGSPQAAVGSSSEVVAGLGAYFPPSPQPPGRLFFCRFPNQLRGAPTPSRSRNFHLFNHDSRPPDRRPPRNLIRRPGVTFLPGPNFYRL